jgi:hypothetical protein
LAGLGGGCSSDSTEAQLEGRWRAQTGDGCAVGLFFEGDRFEHVFGCELEGGGYGYEVWRGPVEARGDDSFTWHPDESSCSGGDTASETLRYEFVGERLRVTTPASVLLLERVPSGGGGGVARFGCFDEQGGFTPGQVERL